MRAKIPLFHGDAVTKEQRETAPSSAKKLFVRAGGDFIYRNSAELFNCQQGRYLTHCPLVYYLATRQPVSPHQSSLFLSLSLSSKMDNRK